MVHQDDESPHTLPSFCNSDLTQEPQASSSNCETPTPHFPTPANSNISLHVMLGDSSSGTLRLTSTIKKRDLTILVDGGSTHNFIQDRLVKLLGLQVQQSTNFWRTFTMYKLLR